MRLIAILIGVALLFWLPIEDVDEKGVTFFAVVLCSWGAARRLLTVMPGVKSFWLRHLFIGGVGGLSVTLLTLLLMAFKTGLHAHGAPDFTPLQVQAVLQRTPYWIAAGILLASCSALWRIVRSQR